MSSIIGTWKLLSYQLRKKGNISFPLGENVRGLLIYQENGYMSGIISGENRPDVTSPASMGISEKERLEISKNFIAYSGKFFVEGNKIVHSVEVSFVPNLMGKTNHAGTFEVNDNNLTISSIPQLYNGVCMEAKWDKIIP